MGRRNPIGPVGLASLLVVVSGSVVRVCAEPDALAPLMRSFDAYAKDLERLDQIWLGDRDQVPTTPPELKAPAAEALPSNSAEVGIVEQVRVDLPQAIALAVRNDPVLQTSIAGVRQQRGLLRSVQGRFYPTVSLNIGGGYNQEMNKNFAWKGNGSIPGYVPDTLPYVRSGGQNRYQTNIAAGFASLRVDYELLSFERSAALAEFAAELDESNQLYGNRLRQLQLDVSEAYYRLQLAGQLKRIRQVVVMNDEVILDQIEAMNAVGLVPRVDLLRAEANLQQQRFLLEQAGADQLSRRRRLSNLVNVPFTVTLEARDEVRLQDPWPLDLNETIVRGFRDNPQLQALQAARSALLRQADRQAAELMPRLGLFATAGYLASQSRSPLIELDGCCGAPIFVPGLNSQTGDWAAGFNLNWRLFDGGVTAGAVEASQAAADQVLQREAAERNAIRQKLETAFYDHRAALRQIIAANSSYKAARVAYRDMRARYEFGLADYTDLADTIRSLTTAMEQKASAMTSANVSYAQLLRELLVVPRSPEKPVTLPVTLPSQSGDERVDLGVSR